MKISCDSCGAIYRIPEEKLTKDVSRATCKKCGAKIIIRRPSGADEALDELRAGGGQQSSAEDDVINHEERTVIAQVPELQKFDATPPLSTGAVSSPDDIRSALGVGGEPDVGQPVDEQTEYETPLRSVDSGVRMPEAAALRTPEVAPAIAPTPLEAQAPGLSLVPPLAQKASAAAVPATPSPTITATTSPARPSGVVAPPPPTPAPPPVVAAASKQKANVVDIFAQQPETKPVAAEFQQPLPKILLVLMGLAFLGVMAFVPRGVWGVTLLTAIGFFVTLYSILAALLAQIDLSSNRKINYARVFSIPALVCALLLALLMSLQSKELAFLHPELDIELVKVWIKERPEIPAAAQDGDIEEKIAAAIKTKQEHHSSTPVRRSGSRPEVTVGLMATPKPDTFSGNDVVVPEGVDPALLAGRTKTKLPQANLVADARAAMDGEAIEAAIERARVGICFETHGRGQDISGRTEFRILIAPDGSVAKAHIADPTRLRGTELENCMVEKVQHAAFPPYSATKPQWYSKTFIN